MYKRMMICSFWPTLSRKQLAAYVAHLVRARHEDIYYAVCSQRCLTHTNKVAILCDYKMKVVPKYFCEGQSVWFGKSGIVLFGVMFIFRINATDKDCAARTYFLTSQDKTGTRLFHDLGFLRASFFVFFSCFSLSYRSSICVLMVAELLLVH